MQVFLFFGVQKNGMAGLARNMLGFKCKIEVKLTASNGLATQNPKDTRK
jgi:hypothetical protein